MDNFLKEVQVRWSDLDPNVHLRHSVYYDWGAVCRIDFLYKYGLTAELMGQSHFGPILFREECIFKREIRLGDTVKVGLKLIKARRDFSRWSIQHDIIKNNETLSAILTVDGAWLDTKARKLIVPPENVAKVFLEMPMDRDIQWLD